MSSSPAISPLRHICVFCASAEGTRPAYRADAEELGRKLASQQIGLIYGGARVGLMGAVADATLSAGGRVTGVIPHVLVDMEVAHHDVTELHIVKSMHDRKALMGEKADAFLILPGGFGTFEELFEVLAWSTLKIHSKPIVLLNTEGFWNGMLAFLDHCIAEGVLTGPKRDLLLVAGTVDDAIRLCVG